MCNALFGGCILEVNWLLLQLLSYIALFTVNASGWYTDLMLECVLRLQFLVEKGADLEIANRHGHTCLMIACYKGHQKIVRYLLERGADVNRKSLKGTGLNRSSQLLLPTVENQSPSDSRFP